VTLHANSVTGALYKNKFESSKTPTGTGMVMSTAVSAAGQTMTELEKSSDLGEISAVTVRLGVGLLPTDCFNAHFQSFVVP